jgi:peptidase E
MQDVREHLLGRDVIYVGGGSVVSMLGAWRAHGLDTTLRQAWESGVILCGLSAGSLCWFAEGVTAFHGPPVAIEGLGFLPWSNCVHFDVGSGRQGAYRQFLAEGMCDGYAAEDGTALHFEGERLLRVVTSRPAARAYRMRCQGARVVRRALASTYLADSEARAPGQLTAVAA